MGDIKELWDIYRGRGIGIDVDRLRFLLLGRGKLNDSGLRDIVKFIEMTELMLVSNLYNIVKYKEEVYSLLYKGLRLCIETGYIGEVSSCSWLLGILKMVLYGYLSRDRGIMGELRYYLRYRKVEWEVEILKGDDWEKEVLKGVYLGVMYLLRGDIGLVVSRIEFLRKRQLDREREYLLGLRDRDRVGKGLLLVSCYYLLRVIELMGVYKLSYSLMDSDKFRDEVSYLLEEGLRFCRGSGEVEFCYIYIFLSELLLNLTKDVIMGGVLNDRV